MNTINLVDYLSPAEIDAVKHTGHGCRQKEYWANVTPEQKEEKLRNSFHSQEARVKSIEATREKSPETRRKISVSVHEHFDTMTEEQKKDFKESYKKRVKPRNKYALLPLEYIEKLFGPVPSYRPGLSREEYWNSPEGEAMRAHLASVASANWASKTPGEKEEWLKASFHNPKVRESVGPLISQGLKRYFGSLTKEELKDRYESFNYQESLKTRFKGRSGPTWPEYFLGFYLEDKYPGIWAYNGCGERGIVIGSRLPDFVRVDGSKELLEVLGTYWHPESDFEGIPLYYKNLGYKCTCIWEYDCCLYDELDKIFGISPNSFMAEVGELK